MTVFRLGLTGSIGMGKSTTAAMFTARGVPVWDADRAVHDAYAKGGAAVDPIATLFPAAERDGAINRETLRKIIEQDPTSLDRIEAIVHPIIAADRLRFLQNCGGPIAVLDIPLLFEKGYENQMDAVLLVTAPPDIQRARVLSRDGMTEARFHALHSRQMPDAQKRAKATHIVETLTIPQTEAYIVALIDHITSKANHA